MIFRQHTETKRFSCLQHTYRKQRVSILSKLFLCEFRFNSVEADSPKHAMQTLKMCVWQDLLITLYHHNWTSTMNITKILHTSVCKLYQTCGWTSSTVFDASPQYTYRKQSASFFARWISWRTQQRWGGSIMTSKLAQKKTQSLKSAEETYVRTEANALLVFAKNCKVMTVLDWTESLSSL